MDNKVVIEYLADADHWCIRCFHNNDQVDRRDIGVEGKYTMDFLNILMGQMMCIREWTQEEMKNE